MITLEDQIRRYATDVAGPAMGEAPADLLDLGRPRHRGRWVLVAALAVFIAGLTWVATRPTELSDQPSVDTVPTSPTLGIIAGPGEIGPCADGGPVGIALEGPAGDGLCMVALHPASMAQSPTTVNPGPPGQELLAAVYLDGRPLGGPSILECPTPATAGPAQPGMITSDTETVLFARVPLEAETARLLRGSGPALETFALPGVPTARFVAVRAPDESWRAELALYDSSGSPVVPDPDGSTECMTYSIATPGDD